MNKDAPGLASGNSQTTPQSISYASPSRSKRLRSRKAPCDSVCFAPSWRFFAFFFLTVYILWWHKPRFGDSWENIWGLMFVLLLAYICLSFSIQVVVFTGQLARRQLRHSLSLPRILAAQSLQLQSQDHRPNELVLEVQLPNILLGIQFFWELQLRDKQNKRQIRLRYQLHSGYNRINLPLQLGELVTEQYLSSATVTSQRVILNQFQRGLYRGDSQCFCVRDFFSCLQIRYRIREQFELAVLPGHNLISDREPIDAHSSQDPLSTTVHKFAQEGFNEQRPYYSGDDPRRINWKLYSRFNELYVRIPEEQQSYSQDLHCYFIMDMACYPPALRSNVLDSACAYFLNSLKELNRGGYRIVVHIPGDHRPDLASGLLYGENNEEAIQQGLAAYPRSYNLLHRNLPNGASGVNPLLQMLQIIRNSERPVANSGSSHLVFVSPHSLKTSDLKRFNNEVVLSDYFPARQSLFIPLSEPSAALRPILMSQPLYAVWQLLPSRLLWRWLLQSQNHEDLRPITDSRTLQLCQNLGLSSLSPSSASPKSLKSDAKILPPEYPYSPRQAFSYPRLLRQLHSWRQYYRQPSRRYCVGRPLLSIFSNFIRRQPAPSISPNRQDRAYGQQARQNY